MARKARKAGRKNKKKGLKKRKNKAVNRNSSLILKLRKTEPKKFFLVKNLRIF